MPIELIQLEPQIYESKWNDVTTLAEVIESLKELKKMLDEAGVARCVVVINLTDVTKLPSDINGFQQIIQTEPRVIGFVVLKATIAAQVLVRIFQKLIATRFELAVTAEESLLLAHDILSHHQQDD